MKIAALDWAVLVAYLVVITGIGLIVGYRVHRTAEYFLGERRFGPWVMAISPLERRKDVHGISCRV